MEQQRPTTTPEIQQTGVSNRRQFNLSKLVIWGSSWGRGFRFHWLKTGGLGRVPVSAIREPGGAPIGWHYLSNATCPIQPRLSYLYVFRRFKDHHDVPTYLSLLKKACVRQVVLDKWFHLIPASSPSGEGACSSSIILHQLIILYYNSMLQYIIVYYIT